MRELVTRFSDRFLIEVVKGEGLVSKKVAVTVLFGTGTVAHDLPFGSANKVSRAKVEFGLVKLAFVNEDPI